MVAICLCATVTACGGDDTGGEAAGQGGAAGGDCPLEGGTVEAFQVNDVTGKTGALGTGQVKGTQAAVELVNDDGGVLGCRVNLTLKDEQLDPAVAVRELRQAVASNKPQVVFGPSLSGSQLAMAEVTNAVKVPFFSGTGGDAQFVVEKFEPGNYLAIPTLYHEGRAAAKYSSESLDCQSYGFMYPDIVAGHDLAAAFKGALEEYAPDAEVVIEQAYSLENTNLGPVVQAIASAAPDCVFGNTLGPNLVTAYQLWQQRGLDIQTIFYPDQDTLESIGDGPVPAGSYGLARSNVDTAMGTTRGKAFIEKFEELNDGAGPNEWGLGAAAAVDMWAAVVEAAGSFDYEDMAATVAEGDVTFDSPYGDDIEILENHQADVWAAIAPVEADAELGRPNFAGEATQVWMHDVISGQLLKDILDGKVKTTTAG